MNTNQLECFLSVAEHLNFSRASEELKLTQPAVSHQIRSLEDELGVKLFRRTSKSVSLTPEGMLFLPDANMILKTAASARERLGSLEHPLPFDVGCHSQAELRLLPPVLRALCRDFPTLRPQLHIVPFESLLGMVENRQLHAAFGVFPGSKKTALSYRELFSCHTACVCAPDHPLSASRSLTSDLLEGPIITSPPHRIPDEVIRIHLKVSSSLSLQERYFGENIEGILTLAKAGLGYTLYPDVPPIREPDLRYIPVTDLPVLSFGLYYRPDNGYPVLRQFIRRLLEQNGVSPSPPPGA